MEVRARVADGDYLGVGPIYGVSGYTGRFRADRFDFVVNIAPQYGAACGTFTYIDQPFDFSAPPKLTARALAAGGMTVLQNYHDFGGGAANNWWKLDLTPVTGGVSPVYTDSGSPAGISFDDSAAGYTPVSGSGLNGTVQFTLNGPFTFDDRGNPPVGPVAPFSPTIDLAFTVTDTDTATGTQTFSPVTFASPEQRWGRLVLGNAYGSELLPVTLPLYAEYYDGTAFQTNAQDNTTHYKAGDVGLSDPDLTDTLVPGDTGAVFPVADTPLVNGVSDPADPLGLSAPGKTGSLDASVDLSMATGSDQEWLRYDWDEDGNHDNDPVVRVVFGIYAGPRDFIYLREPW